MTDDSCLRPQIIDKRNFAVLGPSGKMTIPYGETSFTELKSWYKEKIAELGEFSGGILLRGMTMLADLRASFLESRKTGKHIFAVIPVDDDLKTENELPADAALIVMQSLGVVCFGIESSDEVVLADAVKRLRPFAKVPLAVLPTDGKLSEGAAAQLLSCGAEAFIGLDEKSAATVSDMIEKDLYFHDSFDETESLMLANERSAFFLEHDTTEFSEPIECSAGMSEEMIEACGHNGYDVLRIQINSPEDVLDFVDNAHMATLPVMFCGDNELAVKHALMLYQGRALIDSTSLIDPDRLKKAARKYGAVIY